MITKLNVSEAKMIATKNNVTDYEKRRLVQFWLSLPGDSVRERKVGPSHKRWINSIYPRAKEHFLKDE